MSAARVERLKSLLSRVQERRAAPRVRGLVAVPAPVAAPPEPVAPAPSSHEPGLGVANTMQDLRQISVSSPEPVHEAPLVLEGVQRGAPAPTPPAAHTAATARTTAPTANDLAPTPAARPAEPELLESIPPLSAEPELESLPPAAALQEEAPLSAPSARVEAPLLSRSEPVVRVVSSPRIEAPKSFGELLELSLSLRPR